ncbi:MAG: GspH/FimT family pseudopilin [Halioglobus sp.]
MTGITVLQAVSLRRKSEPGKAGFRGFTLIELMIVLVILGVILLVAIPGFSELNLRTRLKSYANDMVTSAYLARGEAIKRNGSVSLCISTNGTSCLGGGSNDWAQGWIVIAADGTVIRRQQAAENGYIMSTSPANDTLTFQSSGAASTPTVLTVCRKTPTVGSQQKEITISFTGRPSVETINNRTTCG